MPSRLPGGGAVPESPHPLFSIVITTFNRRDIVTRCLESCRQQNEPGAQIVVVDDCSKDDTVRWLNDRYGYGIDLVVHERNRSINPARRTGVEHARGEWIIVLDSDWALYPDALGRFKAIIEGLPPDVLAVRSRIEADNGMVIPQFMPDGVVGYLERIRWTDEEGGGIPSPLLGRPSRACPI